MTDVPDDSAQEPDPTWVADDPEVPEPDAVEQHREVGEATREKPTAPPPAEASEADALEQDAEIPSESGEE